MNISLRIHRYSIIVLFSLAILSSSVASNEINSESDEDQPLLISVKRMTMETALKIAEVGLKTCRAEGVQVSITVLDRVGDVQVVLRDVIAPRISLKISRQKALTALSFNASTSSMQKQERFTNLMSIAKVDELLFSAGGLPIQAGGRILGGVGVSGAPSGKLDEKCAQAGIDAVIDDLEMAD